MRCCFITLGCRVNQYESDAMAELLVSAGHTITGDPALADVVIVNTCTVTNIADRKSRQMLSKAHRLNPNAKLIASGCWTQREPENALKLDGVDAILGSGERARIAELVEALFLPKADDEPSQKTSLVHDIMLETRFEELSAVNENRTRAYLKIQDGCNRFCTYCAIPFARGRLRSRSVASVRSELEKLDREGYPEVVLTGIHLMSYGVDLEGDVNIANAVACFKGLNNIKRIRFGSLEPHLMTDEVINALAEEPRICRQFHLSLQSGSDSVLERMRRGYTSDEYLEICEKLRAAFGNITAITTDIIAGFPGETETELQQTLDFIRRAGLAKIHVFPYSRRRGTKADTMKNQHSNAEKSRRANLIISEARALEREYLSQYLNKEADVLTEKAASEAEDGFSAGYTDTYVRVKLKEEYAPNTIVRVIIDKIEEEKDGELSVLSHSVGRDTLGQSL